MVIIENSARPLPNSKPTKVCILGLGQVGLPTAKYCAAKGLKVFAYDVCDIAVKRARKQGIPRATANWHEMPQADVYIICVSTMLKNDAPNLSPVFDVCEKISQTSSPSSLVSIESTIVPGTSKKIYEGTFKKNISLVHVPHRYWAEDSARHGVKQLRLIGALNQESLNKGLKFYRDILEIPLHAVSSIELAEMSKIAENAYRYVQIAFAEELRMTCEEMELDFNELRNACNTKWNVEILEARDGIRGHCLPKDIQHLASLTPHNAILKSAVVVDKEYREWRSRRLDDFKQQGDEKDAEAPKIESLRKCVP